MAQKVCWLLYDDPDYRVNQDFAAFMAQEGKKRGLTIHTVLLSQLRLGMEKGRPTLRHALGLPLPDAVLSRQRNASISRHFEAMGIPVFNNAKACALCNDKRETHVFLQGLPMLDTAFPLSQDIQPDSTAFPLVMKPACSHGGDRVLWVDSPAQWAQAAEQMAGQPFLYQQPASQPGFDLRVYVVFGQIVAGVLRQAQEGFISNFKKGGRVSLHTLTEEESSLAAQVIARFQAAGAALSFAGIDFLYHQGHPVISEVEDVVGSRMLYQVSDVGIAGLFLDGVIAHMV